MKFSEELNNYMNILDCSPRDLSEISGLSPTIISRYLNNKRTPRVQSEYFDKIVESLYIIASNKNIELNKEKISDTLKNSVLSNDIDFDTFVNNFNTLLIELKLNISDIAKSIGYDVSFISKIKNRSRKPADLDNFMSEFVNYIVQNYKNDDNKKVIASLINCSLNDLNSNYREILIDWLNSSQENNNELVKSFLTKLDTFNLNDYIGTDFSKVKVPTSPVILRNSKTYFGPEGRKKSEGEFLKTTLISKSQEPIYFYNDLPMEEAGEDEDFKQKWVLAMTMLLKKGLHLNMIHNVDRPLNEMLLGLENWIPIYMTGSISPYYFRTPPSYMFLGSYCVSGSAALAGECIKNDYSTSRFYVTTKKEDIEYYKEKSKYMLSKAKPLMTIFKEADKTALEEFMSKEKNSNLQKVEKDIFKNIDFLVNKNKWIMINKKTSPEIHFVIYNYKLRNAIETFLKN